MQNMSVLITGGTGFIGSRLALECLRRGHAVKALGQENTPAESFNRKMVEDRGGQIILRSVTETEGLPELFHGVDVVFHLAATQHEMNVPDKKFWDVNVLGTRNLLEASVRAGVGRFVHGSTIGVYGVTTGVIDESTPCVPDNIYGVTKLEGEKLSLTYRDRIPVAVIRIPEVYGPGDRRLLKLFKAIGKNAFFVIGSGENLHHLIYIDDLVEGLLQAAVHPAAENGLFLLAGNEPVTTNQMVAAIARQLGAREPKFRAPMLPFLAAATVLEKTLRPLGIQPPLHRRRLDFFKKDLPLSPDLAKWKFGFDPKVDFEEGAKRTAEWYQDMGLLGGGGDAHGFHKGKGNPVPWSPPAIPTDEQLTAKMEPFDSFWEAPRDIEKGYERFYQFYKCNYLPHLPRARNARILVVSCGPGYFVDMLDRHGYSNVLGIDSFPGKIAWAEKRNLNCRVERAFGFLARNREPFDVIFAEQEINHLTKQEILSFLELCWQNLSDRGTLLIHSINGTNPLTGSESRAGNFDHYNSFTEYSLNQILEYSRFGQIRIFPLNLYVFYSNPLNYVGLLADKFLTIFFRLNFILVGKSAKIFSKKLAAVAKKRQDTPERDATT
jgi:nucleoside-diphosphate-sugar epimerase/SAM-dependent methyltransferase